MMTRNQTRPARGFTLLEIAVVTVIMVVVLGITFQLMSTLSRGARATSRDIQAQMAATNAMEGMVGMLQTSTMRGLDPANNFTGYGGTTFLFRVPQRDGAGNFTIVNGQVALAVNRTQLVAQGTSLVAQLVDGGGNPIVVPAPQVFCQNLSIDETIAGIDVDGSGALEQGVIFQVISNEDTNGNGVLDAGEDTVGVGLLGNGNGRLDCTVAITVRTVVLDPNGPDHGRAQMTTEVLLRNS